MAELWVWVWAVQERDWWYGSHLLLPILADPISLFFWLLCLRPLDISQRSSTLSQLCIFTYPVLSIWKAFTFPTLILWNSTQAFIVWYKSRCVPDSPGDLLQNVHLKLTLRTSNLVDLCWGIGMYVLINLIYSDSCPWGRTVHIIQGAQVVSQTWLPVCHLLSYSGAPVFWSVKWE